MERRVLLVGCGGLGTVSAEMLVRAGIGRLTLADRDYVDESNLQRQSLYTEADVHRGLPKAIAAVDHLRRINSSVALSGQVADVNPATIESLIEGHDLIMDGTDNFETRFLLNDASLRWRIPWIYGACVGGYGLALAFVPGRTGCLRCVLRDLPAPGSAPTCDTVGILAPAVHMVAAFQTAEALKILTGNEASIRRRLITVDVWENRIRELTAGNEVQPDCPACAGGQLTYLEGDPASGAQVLCGRDAVQIRSHSGQRPDFRRIAERLEPLGSVCYNEYLLRARIKEFEIALFRDGRSIIRGTHDEREANRILSRYIGT